jgi:hypothetical protein
MANEITFYAQLALAVGITLFFVFDASGRIMR